MVLALGFRFMATAVCGLFGVRSFGVLGRRGCLRQTSTCPVRPKVLILRCSQELKLRYYNKEAVLPTMYRCYGKLN